MTETLFTESYVDTVLALSEDKTEGKEFLLKQLYNIKYNVCCEFYYDMCGYINNHQ